MASEGEAVTIDEKIATRSEIERIADAIVDRLFTNGFNEKADRLVLTTLEPRDLGGWSRGAVRDEIIDELRKEPHE